MGTVVSPEPRDTGRGQWYPWELGTSEGKMVEGHWRGTVLSPGAGDMGGGHKDAGGGVGCCPQGQETSERHRWTPRDAGGRNDPILEAMGG